MSGVLVAWTTVRKCTGCSTIIEDLIKYLEHTGKEKSHRSKWYCLCAERGNETVIAKWPLVVGFTKQHKSWKGKIYVMITHIKKYLIWDAILVEGRLKSCFDQATNIHNRFSSWLFFSPPWKAAIRRWNLANPDHKYSACIQHWLQLTDGITCNAVHCHRNSSHLD